MCLTNAVNFLLTKYISSISRDVSLCIHMNTVLQKVNHVMRQCFVCAVYIFLTCSLFLYFPLSNRVIS